MTDPTATILSTSMLIALGAFILAVVARGWPQPEAGGAPPPAPPADDGEIPNPYITPREVTVQPPPLPQPAVPVWPYRPLDFAWMGFLFLTFAVLSLSVAQAAPAATPRLPGVLDLIASMGVQLVLAGMTLGFMVWRIKPAEWLGLRWKQWQWVFLIGPGTVVSMWVIFGLLAASGYMEWIQAIGGDPVQDTVKLLQTTRDPAILALMAVAAVLVAPVCEEVIFRGYLYPAAKKFAGTWVAAGSTSLLFAAAHGNLGALLPLFIFGLVLVAIYEKTRSIWAPIAVHLCFNGATVVIQVLAPYLTRMAEQT